MDGQSAHQVKTLLFLVFELGLHVQHTGLKPNPCASLYLQSHGKYCLRAQLNDLPN